MVRAYFAILSLCLLSTLSSCVDTITIDPELETIYSIECYGTPRTIIGAVIENDVYPCLDYSLCAANFSPSAVFTMSSSTFTDQQIQPVPDFAPTIYLDTTLRIASGDEITLQVRVPNRSFTAKATMPDSINYVQEVGFVDRSELHGIVIQLDSTEFMRTAGLHVLISEKNQFPPNVGFICSRLQLSPATCLNYGFIINSPDTVSNRIFHYIPYTEMTKVGLDITNGDSLEVVLRNYPEPSIRFFDDFNQRICRDDAEFNNGILFAPPENLPTNFDNNGFGFFHLYTEQRWERIAE